MNKEEKPREENPKLEKEEKIDWGIDWEKIIKRIPDYIRENENIIHFLLAMYVLYLNASDLINSIEEKLKEMEENK